jgi:hypothetical protein
VQDTAGVQFFQALPESVRNHFQMQQIQLEKQNQQLQQQQKQIQMLMEKLEQKAGTSQEFAGWTNHRGSCGYSAD